MQKLALTLLIAALAVLPAFPQDQGREMSVEALIMKLDEEWSAAASGHDLDKTVSFYADDAVLMPPNSPMVTKREGFRAAWAPLCDKSVAISWKTMKVEVSTAKDMAYSYGTYTLKMPDGKGGSIEDQGKFLEVWRKQADGSWKCTADMFNSDLPMPG